MIYSEIVFQKAKKGKKYLKWIAISYSTLIAFSYLSILYTMYDQILVRGISFLLPLFIPFITVLLLVPIYYGKSWARVIFSIILVIQLIGSIIRFDFTYSQNYEILQIILFLFVIIYYIFAIYIIIISEPVRNYFALCREGIDLEDFTVEQMLDELGNNQPEKQ